ncbi:MAG: hypothetical protein ACREDT_00255 [Methylocella sp.]
MEDKIWVNGIIHDRLTVELSNKVQFLEARDKLLDDRIKYLEERGKRLENWIFWVAMILSASWAADHWLNLPRVVVELISAGCMLYAIFLVIKEYRKYSQECDAIGRESERWNEQALDNRAWIHKANERARRS